MNNYQEVELKLACREKVESQWIQKTVQEKGWTLLEGPVEQKLQTIYYDSTDQHLSRSGLVLRIRQTETGYEATLKSEGKASGGLHVREEVNHSQSGPEPDPQAYETYPLGKKVIKCLQGETLIPQFETRFQRNQVLLQDEMGNQVEMALDQGDILARGQSEPLNEIELELKEGSALALLKMGKSLAEAMPLYLESRSKYARGLSLAGLMQKEQEKKKLIRKAAAPESLYQLLLEHLDDLIIREKALALNPENPEMIHAYRIAIRTTRALMVFGKGLFPPEAYLLGQKLLKTLLEETGETRQLDVMEGLYHEQGVRQKEMTHFLDYLQHQRLRSQSIWLEKIKTGQTTSTYLDLWILWQETLLERDDKDEVSLKSYYDQRIGQLHKSVLRSEKAGKRGGSAEEHRWRIKAKSLRYILETFEDLNGPKEKKWIGQLKKTQDILGRVRDFQLILTILHSWSTLSLERGQTQLAFEIGLFTGWIDSHTHEKRGKA